MEKNEYSIEAKCVPIDDEFKDVAEALGAIEFKPGMKMSCMYCSKRFEPYIHMINNDYAFISFCNRVF